MGRFTGFAVVNALGMTAWFACVVLVVWFGIGGVDRFCGGREVWVLIWLLHKDAGTLVFKWMFSGRLM